MVCSGVGTPRIMPNSNSKEFPDDIANRHGQLEKNLMFYPLSGVVGLFEEPMEDFKGPMACGIVSQEFCEVDLSRDFVRGYSLHGGRFTTPMTFALGGYGVDNLMPWGQNTDGNSTKFIPIAQG